MRKLLLILPLLLLASMSRADVNLPYTGSLVPVVPNQTVAQFQGTGTVYIFGVQPQQAATIYVTAITSSNGDTVKVTPFVTASNIQSYTGNTQYWIPVSNSSASGAITTTQTITFNGTTQTYSFTTTILNGTQMAVQISNGSNSSATSIAVNVALTPNGITGFGTIQGLTALAGNPANTNPVLVCLFNTTNNGFACPQGINQQPANVLTAVPVYSENQTGSSLVNVNQGVAVLQSSQPQPLAVELFNVTDKFAYVTTNAACFNIIVSGGSTGGTNLDHIFIDTAGSATTLDLWKGLTCSGVGNEVGLFDTTTVHDIPIGLSNPTNGFSAVTAGTTAAKMTFFFKQ